MMTSGNLGGSRSDMKITGNGSSNGGSFQHIKIMGEAIINGDTDCDMFKCMGNSEVNGLLHAGSVKVQGEMKVRNELSASSIGITGELSVGGRMAVEKAKITGELQVGSDCQMEEMLVRGTVEVNGMLNAEEAFIKLYGHSHLRELVGGRIMVKKGIGLPFLGKFIPGTEGSLTADTIEGDTIVLENTKASVVRGRSVTIGSGCRIGLVEYIDEFKQDSEASVSQSAKIRL
ncbi:hypothetical protein MUG84_13310 [Paenibacillus sp. KQZ6P-2]|uniref:Cell shape determination protein CcmA n=1 Tax=Paenibacillus mangrovi TaxID=2931978 RepID=A0A9X1WSI3_9BACL|nr:hypothetical protein [Paenibacillus mangrovi]MCJ8012710.1 hypothetical protein [Paenibacillus mangrovi]